MGHSGRALLLVRLIPVLLVPYAARAQGLSGSEVSGVVRLSDGRAAQHALVVLTNQNTGAERRTTTRSGGAYRFEGVDVGRYRLEARAIGSSSASTDSVELHLGDRLRIDILLGGQTTILEDAVIRAKRLRDAGAGGPAETIAGRSARNIPLMNRDFVGLLTLSSQALGSQGLWVTGQHSRYNGIQIDGAAANDFFGVAITPGSSSGSRLISPEAIEEVRILVAPFDVRMGGFAGGLINAVTRSGSNKAAYSTFAYLTRSELIGTDTARAQVPDFNQIQYGLTAGGPLIRDRLHYFLAAEFQQRAATSPGLSASDPATGVTEATAARIQTAIRNRFGFDPGGTSAPDVEAPSGNVFLKLSWHPRPNMSVELTPSYGTSTRDTLARTTNPVDGWQLSRSGAELFSNTAGAVLNANFILGSLTNHTTAGFSRNLFGIRSSQTAPTFLVQADAANVYAASGSMRGAQGTRTFESVAQLAHNSTWTTGAHTIVAGTQDFLVHVRDELLSARWGVWTFSSVESLEEGVASRYEVALPAERDKPTASYRALLGSLYIQDQWQANSSLRVTAGLRGDAAFLPGPKRNSSLLADDALGNIDTRNIASGNWVLAPRVGFAWSLDKRDKKMLRGGIGYFTARPPFAWITGAYSFTGETQVFLTCNAKEGVPPVTADIDALPASCTGDGGKSSARPSVTYFTRDFRLPQAIKAAIGMDAELFDGWTGSIDVIRTRTKNQLLVSDQNLVSVSTSSEQRAMYGTIPETGATRPSRISTDYAGVYRFDNYTADRSMSASTRLGKEWSSSKLIQVGYTWSRTEDVMGLTGFGGTVFIRNNPVDGILESRKLRRSARDIPHNFVATAIFPVASGFTGGLFFRARSGTPWAFSVSGDANADGASGNDLAYIPRDSSDISLRNPAAFGALDNFINRLGCARSQRGQIMKRNSCRNRAVKLLDGRIGKTFNAKTTHRLELSADVFNIPNLINHRWGIVRETSVREDVPLMVLSGWDESRNRPQYSIPTLQNGVPFLPSINRAVIDASRWRVQIGARYEM